VRVVVRRGRGDASVRRSAVADDRVSVTLPTTALVLVVTLDRVDRAVRSDAGHQADVVDRADVVRPVPVEEHDVTSTDPGDVGVPLALRPELLGVGDGVGVSPAEDNGRLVARLP